MAERKKDEDKSPIANANTHIKNKSFSSSMADQQGKPKLNLLLKAAICEETSKASSDGSVKQNPGGRKISHSDKFEIEDEEALSAEETTNRFPQQSRVHKVTTNSYSIPVFDKNGAYQASRNEPKPKVIEQNGFLYLRTSSSSTNSDGESSN